MGSFIGHLLPGSLFLIAGLWHLANSIFKYVSNPHGFKGRVWHQIPRVRFKYLELYIIVVGAFIDMCIEFFYSTHLKFIVDGGLNSAHLNDFEHAAMLLMFFIFGVTAMISEKTGWLPLPDGALHIIAAMAFTAEFLLFYFHSTNHAGLEGHYHKVLVVAVGACILSAVLGAAFPESFSVDLASSLFLCLQGLWFYQTAFSLYGPLMPTGCHVTPSDVVCDTSGFEMRGQALANLQLSILVSSLLLLTIFLYGTAVRWVAHPSLYYLTSPDRKLFSAS